MNNIDDVSSLSIVIYNSLSKQFLYLTSNIQYSSHVLYILSYFTKLLYKSMTNLNSKEYNASHIKVLE